MMVFNSVTFLIYLSVIFNFRRLVCYNLGLKFSCLSCLKSFMSVLFITELTVRALLGAGSHTIASFDLRRIIVSIVDTLRHLILIFKQSNILESK